MRGRDGSWMKSWVIHPVDASIETGDPIRVTTGKDSFHTVWVVSIVGRGPEPRLSVEVLGGQCCPSWRVDAALASRVMYGHPNHWQKARQGGE